MGLVATVSDSAGLGNFSQLCQKWFRAAFQKVLRNRGAFAALPKQGSTENLEDKLPAFSLGSETTCSSNILSWPFQHSPTSRSPDFLLSYIVRTVKSEQTNPGTTALDSGRVSTSRVVQNAGSWAPPLLGLIHWTWRGGPGIHASIKQPMILIQVV